MALSEEQSKAGNRRLKQWIENDKKVVTYRELSREISCHVNLAKKSVLI
jgi:DNA polymerase delta subunit 3